MRNALNRGHVAILPIAGLLLAFQPCAADEPAADASLRQRRLDFLLSRVDEFQLETAESPPRPLKRGEQPVLRWSNPVREHLNDGVTFLFFEGRRARAIVTVWVKSRESSLESGEQWRECISLSPKPLACRRGGRVVWSPKSGSLVEQPIAAAPPPAARATQRLTQMRQLARRFYAANYKDASPNELRLLSQPLYRYPEETAEVLDGALFAFAEGNDPEALLLLEAVTLEGDKGHDWRYTLARSTSFRTVVRLDDREVISFEPYYRRPRTPNDAYLEANDGPFSLDDECLNRNACGEGP